MSFRTASAIQCDGEGCFEERVDYMTATDLRKEIRHWEGWAVGCPGGRDFCPACAPHYLQTEPLGPAAAAVRS